VALVRFANLLQSYTGKNQFRDMAGHAMRFLAAPPVVEGLGFDTGGLLIAAREFTGEPAHLTIVGCKDDPKARALFAAALRGASPSARIEWLDEREGPLPGGDVQFPALAEPAAFLCAEGACSMPLTTPEQLAARLASGWKAGSSRVGE